MWWEISKQFFKKKKYLNSKHYFWIWESTLAMNRSKRKVDFFFLIRTKYKVLEKEMATHSSILAWSIPWTEEPGRLQSMGSQQSDTTEWLTCTQSLVETFIEIQVVGSLGGEKQREQSTTGKDFLREITPGSFSLPCLISNNNCLSCSHRRSRNSKATKNCSKTR